MNIKCVVVGSYSENCYIIEDDSNAIVIDPGDEFEKIVSNINKNVIGIIITHSHFDHIGALDQMKNKYMCPVYDDSNLLEQEYQMGNFVFEIIKTYGHTNDSITVYFKNNNIMFTGDFLFYHSIGRTDFPTGSVEDMRISINKIKKYPEDTIIYPGHDCQSTLKEEFNYLDTYL